MNDSLQDRFNRLRPKQQQAIERMVDAFLDGSNATANPESDFCTQDFADEFCDRLRAHHTGTLQPLSKDKFEFALVETFNSIGINAAKTTGGTYPAKTSGSMKSRGHARRRQRRPLRLTSCT